MSPGGTFDRVYQALKEQLGSGGFRPGEALEPRALSDTLNSSITPVRDALHRLVGERLVEAPRSSGFRTPILTEVGLRTLYAWNQSLLLLGTAGPGAKGLARETGTGAGAGFPRQRIEILFEAVAARAGNPEHVEAVTRLNERFRSIRVIEARLLGSCEDELGQIEDQLRREDMRALRRSIRAYHRRRERAAALLVAELVGR